jgi:hypothetical protein
MDLSIFSDEELVFNGNQIQAELKRRRMLKDQAEGEEFAKRLERFPEAQQGCETKLVRMSTYNGQFTSIMFEFNALDGFYFFRPLVAMLTLEKNNIDLHVELSPGDSSLWFNYRSEDGFIGPMYPYAVNKGRCDKMLPEEYLKLPWLAKILEDPKKVWDLLTAPF